MTTNEDRLRHLLRELAAGARSKAALLASGSPTSNYIDPVAVLRAIANEADHAADAADANQPAAQLSARGTLLALCFDWRNNYLTIERFAEDHGLTLEEAATLITLARDVASHPHPES